MVAVVVTASVVVTVAVEVTVSVVVTASVVVTVAVAVMVSVVVTAFVVVTVAVRVDVHQDLGLFGERESWIYEYVSVKTHVETWFAQPDSCAKLSQAARSHLPLRPSNSGSAVTWAQTVKRVRREKCILRGILLKLGVFRIVQYAGSSSSVPFASINLKVLDYSQMRVGLYIACSRYVL
jgi:hypothetical protein